MGFIIILRRQDFCKYTASNRPNIALKDGVKYIVECTAQKGLDTPHKITLNILLSLQVHTVCSDHLCVLMWLRLMVVPIQAKRGLQADVSTKQRARTPQSP